MAGGAGGAGGLLNAGTPSAALVTLLQQGSDGYRWTAAAVGSNSAAGIQLGSGEPVMAIGGFNGSDNAPSLAQFKAWVAAHDVHYFIASGGGGGFGNQQGGSNVSSEITSWVEANFTAQTVGGTTVYDLSEHRPHLLTVPNDLGRSPECPLDHAKSADISGFCRVFCTGSGIRSARG